MESATRLTDRQGRRVGLYSRLVGFSLLLIVVAVGVSSWAAYRYQKQFLEAQLQGELLAVVNSVAPAIDGSSLNIIQPPATGGAFDTNNSEFAKARELLLKVELANHLTNGSHSPLYILRQGTKADGTNHMQFVAMTDPLPDGTFYVGAEITTEPHHELALGGKSTSRGLYWHRSTMQIPKW